LELLGIVQAEGEQEADEDHQAALRIWYYLFDAGIIHKKLLEMQEIPFYCTLVKKEDLV
jgi:hypothetical protein